MSKLIEYPKCCTCGHEFRPEGEVKHRGRPVIDIETRHRVIRVAKKHPDWGVRKIARAVGDISHVTVWHIIRRNKAIKKMRADRRELKVGDICAIKTERGTIIGRVTEKKSATYERY